MGFPIKGNDMASVMQRKNINDKKKDKEYDEKDKLNNLKKNKSELIESYNYKDRNFLIKKIDGIYEARSGQMVVSNNDLEVLKNKKIPEYVENEIKK